MQQGTERLVLKRETRVQTSLVENPKNRKANKKRRVNAGAVL